MVVSKERKADSILHCNEGDFEPTMHNAANCPNVRYSNAIQNLRAVSGSPTSSTLTSDAPISWAFVLSRRIFMNSPTPTRMSATELLTIKANGKALSISTLNHDFTQYVNRAGPSLFAYTSLSDRLSVSAHCVQRTASFVRPFLILLVYV